MDSDIRLLIADANNDYRAMMASAIDAEREISLIGCASDGQETMKLIQKSKVDVLLLDLILPGGDGLYVLGRLQTLARSPAIVVNTSFLSGMMASSCTQLGVSAVLIKPSETATIIERVRCAHEFGRKTVNHTHNPSKADQKRELTELMQTLGMSAHYCGYYYLREAVMVVLHGEPISGGMTKVIYPEVARTFSTTSVRVERCIRTMIEKLWDHGGALNFRRILGVSISEKRLCNSEIIAIIAEHMRFNDDIKRA